MGSRRPTARLGRPKYFNKTLNVRYYAATRGHGFVGDEAEAVGRC